MNNIIIEAIKYALITKKKFGNQYVGGRIHPHGTYQTKEAPNPLNNNDNKLGRIWDKNLNTSPQPYRPIHRYSQRERDNTFSFN